MEIYFVFLNLLFMLSIYFLLVYKLSNGWGTMIWKGVTKLGYPHKAMHIDPRPIWSNETGLSNRFWKYIYEATSKGDPITIDTE